MTRNEKLDEVLLLKRKIRALAYSIEEYVRSYQNEKEDQATEALAKDAITVFKQLSSGGILNNLTSDELGRYYAFNDKPQKNGM